MKAIFAVISIGFLALANGTCLPPIICSTEPGYYGALICDIFCVTIGASTDSCTTSNYPTQSTCQCIGPRYSNIITNTTLAAYATAFPPVCALACVSCLTQPKAGTAIINETSDPPRVSVSCDCQEL